MNLHFIKLLAINFHMGCSSSIPESCNGQRQWETIRLLFYCSVHELRVRKNLGFFVRIKPLGQLFTIVIKDQYFVTSQYSIKKWIIQVPLKLHLTYFKMSTSLSFTGCNPFLEFLQLNTFLRSSDIVEMLTPIA